MFERYRFQPASQTRPIPGHGEPVAPAPAAQACASATLTARSLRRPQLLIRAARCGQADYNRIRDLKRLLGTASPCTPERALAGLLDLEAQQEEARLSGAAGYMLARHVDLLIAIAAELQLAEAVKTAPDHLPRNNEPSTPRTIC